MLLAFISIRLLGRWAALSRRHPPGRAWWSTGPTTRPTDTDDYWVSEYPRPASEELALLGGLPSVPNGDGLGVVCFDLETTGLSGGAGTGAFLVGFGWFDRGAFRTCQYFLPTLAAERRMLNVAGTMLERAATLVTFNGKSFDVPIADARFVFHRLASPFGILGHVDLLHPARRLWPLSDTRLTGLEQAVLGIRRDGDVPGAEMRGTWRSYVAATPNWWRPCSSIIGSTWQRSVCSQGSRVRFCVWELVPPPIRSRHLGWDNSTRRLGCRPPRRRLALEHRVRRITRKLERALTVQTEPRSLLGTSSGEP